MFKKVLVSNRGEIAVRVMRTCKRLGIRTVAVHSDADASAPHVRFADEAVRLGPAPVKDSYLRMDAIADAVRQTGADAVHPGYGLLSENADFAKTVAGCGATFVGPPVSALAAFGDKIRARAVARSVGVEPPPGTDGPIDPSDATTLESEARRIGVPILVKAAGGGGGIGMQIVSNLDAVAKASKTCSDRALAAFGDPRIYLERYLPKPRHIEVQVFRDEAGHCVALGERECSVQRRHQKVLEESPSPAAFFSGPEGEKRRLDLYESAKRIVAEVDYLGAGTVEFVADENGKLYFLEVNARLQVEHPVTELVTGLDLVELQLLVASGGALPKSALEASVSGHAVEVRLYAEDPSKGFIPQPGRLERLSWPTATPNLRIDAGVDEGGEVTPYYDPLIAKVVASGPTRKDAIARLRAGLLATVIDLRGPKGPRTTNLAFLQRILDNDDFVGGSYDTSLGEALAKKA